MRVLVACEVSGVVRDAFAAAGHDAWSCDLQETLSPGQHIVADAGTAAYCLGPWDLMIAHPPCQYLAVSGARWFKDRVMLQNLALDFVSMLMAAPINRICIENPVSVISSRIRKPDQIIQPWMFGHPESKKTCLWLKHLPLLTPTNVLEKPACGYWANQTPSGQNKLGPSSERSAIRAKTYTGIATAMAEQWGILGEHVEE